MKKTYRINQKLYLLISLLYLLFISISHVNSQNINIEDKQTFENTMDIFIQDYITDQNNLNEIKNELQLSEGNFIYSKEYVSAYAEDRAKTMFIKKHMKQYLNLYFPPSSATAITTVCDNGGFEQGFLHYSGSISTYKSGSNDCVPIDTNSLPITYLPVATPYTDRLEIVTTGTDQLVGIQKVKFGSQALRINNRYGHITNAECVGSKGVDRIVKEFTVTEETRKFTVWYAVVLENPSFHYNVQPFLNIKCDLAPANELCFDADFLDCEGLYEDSICVGAQKFDSIDVLDWSCHRFNIPSSEIGNIATLEIIVGDCGLGEHFGYAYIDGICEDCDSSALGSISLDTVISSCDLYNTSICGHYTLPNVCDKNWGIKSITVPGYDIENLQIDTANHTFCFDFPLTNFDPQDDCLEIFAEIEFNSGSSDLPIQVSNTIDVCKEHYGYVGSIIVSQCYDNSTSDNISDDYYYVTIEIRNAIGRKWDIYRQLLDPYPNESGRHIMAVDSNNAVMTFGPFLIQDGPWNAEITIDSSLCYYELLVTPPPYCGSCTDYNDMIIDNVKCISGSTDKWTFDIKVPGTGSFYLTYPDGSGMSFTKGSAHPITAGDIATGCQKYKVKLTANSGCESEFIICPPKPCSVTCDIESRVKYTTCTVVGTTVSYTVQLDVTDNSGNLKCYLATSTDAVPIILGSGALPNPQNIGPFTEDIFLTILLCDPITGCTPSCVPDCYKSIYIALPEASRCTQPLISGSSAEEGFKSKELMVYPNPIQNDELYLSSTMNETQFEIFDSNGSLIHKDQFKGKDYSHKINLQPGVYLIRYKSDKGISNSLKFVKL